MCGLVLKHARAVCDACTWSSYMSAMNDANGFLRRLVPRRTTCLIAAMYGPVLFTIYISRPEPQLYLRLNGTLERFCEMILANLCFWPETVQNYGDRHYMANESRKVRTLSFSMTRWWDPALGFKQTSVVAYLGDRISSFSGLINMSLVLV